MIHCAVGLVFNSQNEILISKRPSPKSKSHFWEFPGGKIEPEEDAILALIRELQEEVGIIPHQEQIQPFLAFQYHYPEGPIHLEFFVVPSFLGEAKGLEGQQILWVPMRALENYEFLPANQIVIQKLYKIFL